MIDKIKWIWSPEFLIQRDGRKEAARGTWRELVSEFGILSFLSSSSQNWYCLSLCQGNVKEADTKWFCTISILFAWDTYNVCTSNLKVLGSFWSRVTCATCDGVQECSLCRRPGENWTISLQLWEGTTIVREVLFSYEMLKTQCNCAKIITTPGNVKPSKLERHTQLSDVAKGRRLKFGIFFHLFDGD